MDGSLRNVTSLWKSNVVDGHFHMAYVKSGGHSGVSTSEGHDHEIVPTAAGDGFELRGLITQEGEEPHDHTLFPYAPDNSVKDDKTEEEILATVTQYRLNLKAQDADFMTEGKENWDFYKLNQWDDSIEKDLEDEDRPVLVDDQHQAMVHALLGQLIAHIFQWHATPRDGRPAQSGSFEHSVDSCETGKQPGQQDGETFHGPDNSRKRIFLCLSGLGQKYIW